MQIIIMHTYPKANASHIAVICAVLRPSVCPESDVLQSVSTWHM